MLSSAPLVTVANRIAAGKKVIFIGNKGNINQVKKYIILYYTIYTIIGIGNIYFIFKANKCNIVAHNR